MSKTVQKLEIVTIFLVFVLAIDTVWACSGGPSLLIEKATMRYMAQGYGLVSALLAVGCAYLKVRLSGWKKFMFHFLTPFPFFYLYNSGWHYKGTGGDCGAMEYSQAIQSVFFMGLLFAWQIGVAILVIHRSQTTTNFHLLQIAKLPPA